MLLSWVNWEEFPKNLFWNFDKKMMGFTVRTFFNWTIIPLSSVNACVTPRFWMQTLWITAIIVDQSWIRNVVDVRVFKPRVAFGSSYRTIHTPCVTYAIIMVAYARTTYFRLSYVNVFLKQFIICKSNCKQILW